MLFFDRPGRSKKNITLDSQPPTAVTALTLLIYSSLSPSPEVSGTMYFSLMLQWGPSPDAALISGTPLMQLLQNKDRLQLLKLLERITLDIRQNSYDTILCDSSKEEFRKQGSPLWTSWLHRKVSLMHQTYPILYAVNNKCDLKDLMMTMYIKPC